MYRRLASFYSFTLPNTWFAAVKLPLIFTASMIVAALSMSSTAQAASCKIPKTYYKNVSCTATAGYFLALKDYGEPVALINSQGKVMTDLLSYQKVDATKMAEGLLPILRKGRVGYIDLQGREIIPPIYDTVGGGENWARAASEGRIVVKKSGQFGVISTSNQTIVPFSAAISEIDNYKGGRARIRNNKASSWVDKNGNPMQEFAASSAPNTNQARDNTTATASTNMPKKADNTYGGQTPRTQPPAYQSLIADPSSDNIVSNTQSVSPFTTLHASQQEGKWGFVDDNNVVMITYSFDEVRPFAEGLAGVRLENNWGFLNLGGEVVIPFDFDNNRILPLDSSSETPSFVFNNGRAWVNNLSNGAKMCINKAGSYVGCN